MTRSRTPKPPAKSPSLISLPERPVPPRTPTAPPAPAPRPAAAPAPDPDSAPPPVTPVPAIVTPGPAPRAQPSRLLMVAARLGVLGVGLGVVFGTAVAATEADPALLWRQGRIALASAIAPADVPVTPPESAETSEADSAPIPPALAATTAIAPLLSQFQSLAAPKTQLTPGAFFYDLDTGEYADLAGDRVFSAASTIKVPILVAFFQAVDRGQVQLEELLTMRPDLIGGGSGAMQYRDPGTRFTALETATQTIVISDNTATNMLIDRLGGADKLNAQFREWGLEHTAIRNLLPDLEGTNTTSPRDMVRLLARVERGELLSPKSRDRLLNIMERTKTKTLLPQGLGDGATIAHKTGDIGSTVGDVGIIDLPTGKRYLAAALVERPHNDPAAQELIRGFSKAAYEHFQLAPVAPITAPAPAADATPSDP